MTIHYITYNHTYALTHPLASRMQAVEMLHIYIIHIYNKHTYALTHSSTHSLTSRMQAVEMRPARELGRPSAPCPRVFAACVSVNHHQVMTTTTVDWLTAMVVTHSTPTLSLLPMYNILCASAITLVHVCNAAKQHSLTHSPTTLTHARPSPSLPLSSSLPRLPPLGVFVLSSHGTTPR